MLDNHWTGKKPNPDKYFGFIYEITNTLTGKKYIGKKQYKMLSRKKVKGHKNRKRVYTENWMWYTGSSDYVNADIKEFGKENFTFKILWNCTTKGMLSYKEVELIVKKGALIKKDSNGERLYYNNQFQGIRFIPIGECK